MEKPIVRNGFLVIQGSPGGWSQFFNTKEEAEGKAKEMVSTGYSMLVIAATQFTRDGK